MPESTSTLVRRESLTEQTVKSLRDAILDGAYPLGQKLPEGELVARFGVSSSVIREALHVLQGEGVIVTRPYCGRSVFCLRPEEGSELLTMRASLESYAAYLAASKMTPQKGDGILKAAHQFIASSPATYGEWVDRELEFHGLVWAASENEWLIRQLSQFSLPIFAMRRPLSPQQKDVRTLWQESQYRETIDNPQGHQALAKAIVKGDAIRARSMMLTHILPAPDATQKEIFGSTIGQ
jgi:DNA-binding GntR family transcriptional regulator